MESDVRLAKELKKVLVEFGEEHGIAPLAMVTLLGSMILDLGVSLEAEVKDDLHSEGYQGSAPFLKIRTRKAFIRPDREDTPKLAAGLDNIAHASSPALHHC